METGSWESSTEEPLSPGELSELPADATDMTPEEIERQTAGLGIAPPDEANHLGDE